MTVTQPDLFSVHTYTSNKAPETSTQAAQKVAPRTPSQRQRVLQAIKELGGATDEEISDYLHLSENSVRPRRLELARLGLVCDTGLRRNTKLGNPSVLWKAIQ